MKDYEILIEVAKVDGLEQYGFPFQEKYGSIINREGWTRRERNNNKLIEVPCPNYLTSRDAIVPVIEKRIEQGLITASQISGILYDMGVKYSFQATALQLCIALLKALGKWKE